MSGFILRTRQLTKKYNDHHAIDQVDLTIECVWYKREHEQIAGLRNK